MKAKTVAIVLFTIVFFSKSTMGQSITKEPKFYNWFDDQVKLYNTGLFNGIKYIELYRTINEKHKFFQNSEFQIGSVVYDGQLYDQVPIKYDLDTDELLLNIGYNYQFPTIILFKSKVKSFQIGKSKFTHIVNNTIESEYQGFYEVLVDQDSLALLKKNSKKRLKKIRGTTVYYEFIPENNYVVMYDGDLYSVKNKQDVVRIWPSKKEFINENYNPELKKSNEDEFWATLFSKLSDSFKAKNIGEQP